VPPAYDIHPEFGYFCPAPRMRRELRVAVVSILAGMAIGAAIMAIHAGQAAETEAVSGNAQLKSSAPDSLAAVPAASPRIKDADNARADPVETIKPDGARAFEQGSVTPCSDSARPHRATGAASLRRSGLARERRGSGLARGFTAGAISRSCRARRFRDQEAAKRYACQTPPGRRE